jgi:hypothetical protein
VASGVEAVADSAEAVALGVVGHSVAAPRFVADLAVVLTADLASTAVSAAALAAEVLATVALAIRISDMALVTPAATATRITRITAAPEWPRVSTAERIDDRRCSTLTFGKLAARNDRGMRRNASAMSS